MLRRRGRWLVTIALRYKRYRSVATAGGSEAGERRDSPLKIRSAKEETPSSESSFSGGAAF